MKSIEVDKLNNPMENFIIQTVDSSSIDKIGQSKLNPTIILVEFKTGRKYEYTGVPQELYELFLNAESKGKFFNKYIRTYPYNRVEEER